MELKKTSHPEKVAPSDFREPDPTEVALVKEIILLLANAVSAAKLFPPEHPSVSQFIADLSTKLNHYLSLYWKLELGVEEYAFTFKGKRIYEDHHPAKSLPFFFFKDGVQTLYFYQGLEVEELKGFIETIREVAQLPPEEADIVCALWERDFPNIRYSAPDEFLESRIGSGKAPLEIKVHREEFSRGRIDLAPEDLEEIRKIVLEAENPSMEKADSFRANLPPDVQLLAGPREEKELKELEALLLSSRKMSSDEEYQSLILEIICLEEKIDNYHLLGTVIKDLHQKALRKKNFDKASRLIASLQEIKEAFLDKDKMKAEFIEATIQEIKKESLLSELQDSLRSGEIKNMEALLEYLGLVGARAAPVVAEVFELSEEPRLRQKALQTLQEIGKSETGILADLAQDSKPILTKEIIRILGRLPARKAISFLAGFVRSKNRDIQLEAIHVLGEMAEETADKILLGFLTEDDEEIRIAAAQSLSSVHHSTLEHLLALTKEKSFAKKKLAEIKAIFSALAKSNSGEACMALKTYLPFRSFWVRSRKMEIALLAAGALSAMSAPLAKEVLEEGLLARSKKIQRTCRQALAASQAQGSTGRSGESR